MLIYVLKRVLQMVPPLFGLTVILFVLVRVGGDPVGHLVRPDASQAEIAEVRRAYGFDKPLYVQYLTELRLVVTGDFGESYRYKQSAMPLVLERLPATIELALAAIVIALLIAVPAGILSAVYQNSPLDLFVTTTSTLGRAMPPFWVGIMLILVLGVQLRWLPVSGRGGIATLIMPAFTLGASVATTVARLLRSSLLEVMRRDYMTTARAKGVGQWAVVFRHGLKNSLVAVVTVLGLQMAWLLGGSVIVEQVFAWPGIGRLIIKSVQLQDLTVVQAGVLMFALIVMGTNLLVDIIYAYLNPRIRFS